MFPCMESIDIKHNYGKWLGQGLTEVSEQFSNHKQNDSRFNMTKDIRDLMSFLLRPHFSDCICHLPVQFLSKPDME